MHQFCGVNVYTLEELSEKSGISIVALRRYIKRGQLGARRLARTEGGTQYVVSERALLRFLEGDNANGSRGTGEDEE